MAAIHRAHSGSEQFKEQDDVLFVVVGSAGRRFYTNISLTTILSLENSTLWLIKVAPMSTFQLSLMHCRELSRQFPDKTAISHATTALFAVLPL